MSLRSDRRGHLGQVVPGPLLLQQLLELGPAHARGDAIHDLDGVVGRQHRGQLRQVHLRPDHVLAAAPAHAVLAADPDAAIGRGRVDQQDVHAAGGPARMRSASRRRRRRPGSARPAAAGCAECPGSHGVQGIVRSMQVASNLECRMWCVECGMSNVECRNVECRMSNVECRMSNVRCFILNAVKKLTRLVWRRAWRFDWRQ